MYSGVPNAGAPDCMSTFEVKPAVDDRRARVDRLGQDHPGQASAFCSARAPARVTGAIARPA
jgi:hypothetical protein